MRNMNNLTPFQQAILLQLGHGKSQAVRGSTIAQRLNFKDDRQVRIAIREMIAEGVPIASTTHPPYGYFIIQGKEEAEEYIGVTRHRIIQDCLRLRDFKRASRKERVPEQLAMI